MVLAGPNSNQTHTCSPGRTVRSPECCKWFHILDDIQANLLENECGPESHESLRIIFHDAIGFSKTGLFNGSFAGGGAVITVVDGSIMINADVELNYKENAGLDEMIYEQRDFAVKHSVSFGDFIHFAGAVGVSNCMGGPRLQFLAGRANISRPAPDYMIPAPFHSADQIFARMEDAGFSPEEVAQLMAAHSVGAQHLIDPTVNNAPLDSTPEDFDAQFFVETLLEGTEPVGNGTALGERSSPIPGEFRLQSDIVLARDIRSACEWQSFITDQDAMIEKFQRVMAKLSTLGQDTDKLTDCSEVIPVPSRVNRLATLPPGKSRGDVQAACSATPFPAIPTTPGPVTSLPPVRHKYPHH
ncbi:unnamed protein product [Somion occarium]|uniref:Peroxidase n=1 Tax=Somion occarium TaxID=3059160 RepID=A0ABP1CQZ3_9APHY